MVIVEDNMQVPVVAVVVAVTIIIIYKKEKLMEDQWDRGQGQVQGPVIIISKCKYKNLLIR